VSLLACKMILLFNVAVLSARTCTHSNRLYGTTVMPSRLLLSCLNSNLEASNVNYVIKVIKTWTKRHLCYFKELGTSCNVKKTKTHLQFYLAHVHYVETVYAVTVRWLTRHVPSTGCRPVAGHRASGRGPPVGNPSCCPPQFLNGWTSSWACATTAVLTLLFFMRMRVTQTALCTTCTRRFRDGWSTTYLLRRFLFQGRHWCHFISTTYLLLYWRRWKTNLAKVVEYYRLVSFRI